MFNYSMLYSLQVEGFRQSITQIFDIIFIIYNVGHWRLRTPLTVFL